MGVASVVIIGVSVPSVKLVISEVTPVTPPAVDISIACVKTVPVVVCGLDVLLFFLVVVPLPFKKHEKYDVKRIDR